MARRPLTLGHALARILACLLICTLLIRGMLVEQTVSVLVGMALAGCILWEQSWWEHHIQR